MLIGIIGKDEEGRALVTKIFNEYGKYEIINVDELYLELIKKEEVKETIEKFVNYQNYDTVDFYVVLYTHIEKRKLYNELIWDYIEKDIYRRIEISKKPVIIEWDKLQLTDFYDMCDIKILVELNRGIKQSFKNVIPIQYQKGKPSFKRDKIDNMTRLFYDALTDIHVDYKYDDMDYIIDDSFINGNIIDKEKVKSINKKM